ELERRHERAQDRGLLRVVERGCTGQAVADELDGGYAGPGAGRVERRVVHAEEDEEPTGLVTSRAVVAGRLPVRARDRTSDRAVGGCTPLERTHVGRIVPAAVVDG